MNYPIPTKALEHHLAILGKTGSGKTTAAKAGVEQILDAGGRVAVLDPTGAWWGMKSSATGKSAGYPFVIFGGSHADFPLGATHGEAIAEIVGTSNTPAIIDTSQLKVSERTRLFTDFADAVMRKNRGPLHLIIDEAHMFTRAAPTAGNGTGNVGGGSLAKAERAILTALVHSGGTATKSKVAVMAGYSISGGGFNNALGSLRTKGFILQGEPIQATDEGIAAVGDVGSLPQGDELLAHWMAQLGKAEGSALKVIFDAYPNYIEKDEVAAAAGYEASGGGFNNALGRLRTLELIEGRGVMRASAAFFP